jgi:hypothetical protein
VREHIQRGITQKREGFRLITVVYVLEVNLLINQAVHANDHFYLFTFCWFKYANYTLNGLVTFRKKDERLRNEVQQQYTNL